MTTTTDDDHVGSMHAMLPALRIITATATICDHYLPTFRYENHHHKPSALYPKSLSPTPSTIFGGLPALVGLRPKGLLMTLGGSGLGTLGGPTGV